MQRNETLFMEQIASRIRDRHPDWEISPLGFGFQTSCSQPDHLCTELRVNNKTVTD